MDIHCSFMDIHGLAMGIDRRVIFMVYYPGLVSPGLPMDRAFFVYFRNEKILQNCQ